MGVIYKLTPEVVDFILRQKRSTPALGCRDLAKIVAQEFTFSVSKSSINAVLQGRRLSSPVGRRKLGGRAQEKKKFTIPQHRKEQLFLSSQPTELKSAVSPKQEPASPKQTPSEDLHVAILSSPKRIPAPSLPEEKAAAETFMHAGSLFLWAILREVSAQSPLLGIVAGKVKEASADEISRVLDTIVISKAMGKDPKALLEAEAKALVRFLCGLDKGKNFSQLCDQILDASLSEEETMKICLDLPSTLARIHQVKFLLKDGKEIVLDARFRFKNKVEGPSRDFVFIEKVLDIVTRQLINNLQPLVLPQAGTQNQEGTAGFSDDFLALVAACENIPDQRITKILLYDDQAQELVGFETIPEKKRIFLAGLPSQEQKFSELLSQLKVSQKKAVPASLSFGGQDLYAAEGPFVFPETSSGRPPVAGRVIFISRLPEGDPEFAILTNASAKDLPAVKAVLEYAFSVPGFLAPLTAPPFMAASLTGEKDITQILSSVYDRESLFAAFSGFLRTCCQQRFFPAAKDPLAASEALNALWELSAQVLVAKDFVKISFCAPSGKPFLSQPLLKEAIFIFNQAGIKDPEGKIFLADSR